MNHLFHVKIYCWLGINFRIEFFENLHLNLNLSCINYTTQQNIKNVLYFTRQKNFSKTMSHVKSITFWVIGQRNNFFLTEHATHVFQSTFASWTGIRDQFYFVNLQWKSLEQPPKKIGNFFHIYLNIYMWSYLLNPNKFPEWK